MSGLGRLLREWRFGFVLLGWYVGLRLAFAVLGATRGIISPEGTPHLGVLVLGVCTIAMRLVVLYVLPPYVTYRIVLAAARAWKR